MYCEVMNIINRYFALLLRGDGDELLMHVDKVWIIMR